jgi:dihydrofolate reductase
MRKIILLMHVSLDGFVCGPNGEMDWIMLGDEMWDYVTKITDSADIALFGEVTYHMMEDKPNASKHDSDHAKWANTVEKIVFSKTLQEVHWAGARIVRDHIVEEMQKLKDLPGKNLLMLGSPSLAHSFMELGLIDEYRLNINPLVIGSGKLLFRDIKQKMNLKLIGEKTFSTGVVALHYDLIK